MLRWNIALFYLFVGHCVFYGRRVKNKRTKNSLTVPTPRSKHTLHSRKCHIHRPSELLEINQAAKKTGLSLKHHKKHHWSSQQTRYEPKRGQILLLLSDLLHSMFGFGPCCSENHSLRRDIRIWPENAVLHVLEKCAVLTKLPEFLSSGLWIPYFISNHYLWLEKRVLRRETARIHKLPSLKIRLRLFHELG